MVGCDVLSVVIEVQILNLEPIAGSSNGRTTAFEAVYTGSNPVLASMPHPLRGPICRRDWSTV